MSATFVRDAVPAFCGMLCKTFDSSTPVGASFMSVTWIVKLRSTATPAATARRRMLKADFASKSNVAFVSNRLSRTINAELSTPPAPPTRL